MARPIGTGNISFGLVSIPVKLYPTTDHSKSVRFNMLDPKDNVRVKQQYINPNSGDVVERKEMVKGYEFAKGQYVTFTNAEVKDLMERASPAIAITEFVPLVEVDPIYFSSTYFLGPETGGERAYRLLGEAMNHTGRCALAKYAARGKQYLVMIRPYEDGLLMQQMHYHDEIRSIGEVPMGDEENPKEIQPAELELAIQLIEQIANDEFEPEQYSDEVRERILAAIQQKVDGAEITAAVDEAPKAEIIDLMEALKQSLGVEEKAGKKPAKKAKATAKSKKKAASG